MLTACYKRRFCVKIFFLMSLRDSLRVRSTDHSFLFFHSLSTAVLTLFFPVNFCFWKFHHFVLKIVCNYILKLEFNTACSEMLVSKLGLIFLLVMQSFERRNILLVFSRYQHEPFKSVAYTKATVPRHTRYTGQHNQCELPAGLV